MLNLYQQITTISNNGGTMKQFKFGLAEVTIHRHATFLVGCQEFHEVLISTKGEVQPFYIKNEVMDLTALTLEQNFLEKRVVARSVENHEPVNGWKAYELKWVTQNCFQSHYITGGQAI